MDENKILDYSGSTFAKGRWVKVKNHGTDCPYCRKPMVLNTCAHNKSFAHCTACNETFEWEHDEKIRGYNADHIVTDEAPELPAEKVKDAKVKKDA